MSVPGTSQKLGKYEIVRKIGQGSFGVVYEGRDPYLKRQVAIKVCSLEDRDLRRRFFREAEISGRLQHRNIVTVHDFGVEDDVPYLVQEFLTGEDLEAAIKRRTALTAEEKLDILIQIGDGLDYAHRRGVVHRDIKPGNVRLLPDRAVKIMDFGIAKLASAETQLTQRGVTLGTASYLPPEQVRGSEVDQRADVFSFGVLAFELLSYERPFRGGTLSALVYQILYKVAPTLSEIWPPCPPELSALVARCLEKKPEARPQGFDTLVPELAAIRQRVAAGEWPELRQAPLTAAPPAEAADDTGSDVLSHSAVAQTAREMEQGHLGDATVSISGRAGSATPTAPPTADATAPALPTDLQADATQPVKASLPPPPPPAAGRAAKTSLPVAELPTTKLPTAAPAAPPPLSAAPPPAPPPPTTAPPPPPRAGAEAGEGSDSTGLRTLGGSPVLADRGREIGTLIAQGQLEEALQQLESTLGEVRSATLGGAGQRLAPGPQPPPYPAAGSPAAGSPAAGVPHVALDRPLPPPSTPAASGAFRTAIRDRRVVWTAAAVAVVALVVVLVATLGGEGAPTEPTSAAVTTPPTAPPVAGDQTARGWAAVHAAPWAEITEITDGDGYLQPLPEEVVTPRLLELPPGRYQVHLRLPGGDTRTCEVEVAGEAPAPCLPVVGPGAPAPTVDAAEVSRYFKETGWWS